MNPRRLIIASLAALLLLAADRPLADPARSLAGRYYAQFPNGLVTGEKYTGENIVEVTPVAPRAAYVRIHLDYFNGHVCGIYGVATSQGEAIVYRDTQPDVGNGKCVLTLRRAGKSLSIDDAGGSCRAHCGARGTLSNVTLPYESKRTIRYLPRLKRSPQYRHAMVEWRAR